MKIFIWAFTVIVVAFSIYRRQAQSAAFNRFAKSLGLNYQKNKLPKGLSLADVNFCSVWDTVSNVWCGECEKKEIAIFYLHANHGDFGYKQTTFAFRSQVPLENLSTFWNIAEIKCQRAGEWILMYRSKREIEINLLPDFLSECIHLVEYLESKNT